MCASSCRRGSWSAPHRSGTAVHRDRFTCRTDDIRPNTPGKYASHCYRRVAAAHPVTAPQQRPVGPDHGGGSAPACWRSRSPWPPSQNRRRLRKLSHSRNHARRLEMSPKSPKQRPAPPERQGCSFSARGLVQGTGDFPGIAITLDLLNWAHGQHARCRHGARQRAGGVLSETNSPSTRINLYAAPSREWRLLCAEIAGAIPRHFRHLMSLKRMRN